MAAPGVLVCRDLRKGFAGGGVALDGLSLKVAAGEFFTVLGPPGCGKTTLLRAIAGFEVPESGTIALGGKVLDGLPPHLRPVNTVFQGQALFPHMSVVRNIAFALEMQRRRRAEIASKVEDMLALMRLEDVAGRMPHELSGGQQQRVALARALAPGPRLLLLDEPLSALDRGLRGGMRLELKRLQAQTGITFVFVTQDQHEAMAMSDRIAVMRAGRVEQVGTPEAIYERPESRFVADFVGAANLLPARRVGARRFAVAGAVLEAAEDLAAADRGGGEVTLVLRPERAVVMADRPNGGQGLHGVVMDTACDGADPTCRVAVAGGIELVACIAPGGVHPPGGTGVHVAIAPAALRAVAQ
jgi:spermidine/putrescine transport system ATP-binding protein